MKCIKKNDEVRKVDDKEAREKVLNGWEYCSRESWRKANNASGPKPSEKDEKAEITPKKKKHARNDRKGQKNKSKVEE